MGVKTDCKFYNEKTGKCIALKKLYCQEEEKECNFYKKRDNNKDDTERDAGEFGSIRK